MRGYRAILLLGSLFAVAELPGYEYAEDFSVASPGGWSHAMDIERNSTLSHRHASVRDGVYCIPVDGNRHFLATPPLGDFRLEADYTLVPFRKLYYTLGFVVFFRYDRRTRQGHRLEVCYDRDYTLRVGIDGRTIFTRADGKPRPLDAQRLVLSVAGGHGHVETLGASVDFDVPADGPARGNVGFDLSTNQSIKLLLDRLSLVSPEDPKAVEFGRWSLALAGTQGSISPPRYEVCASRYETGEVRLDCTMSGTLLDHPRRDATGGSARGSMLELLTTPYVRIVAADGTEIKVPFWNGAVKLFDPQVKGDQGIAWPCRRSYVFREFPEDFTVAGGYERAMVNPWRFAANGPYEQVRTKDGAMLLEGQAVGSGRLSFRTDVVGAEGVAARLPADLPRRGLAVKHAREGGYFLESETPRFTLEAVWRRGDYSVDEIALAPRLETVYGERSGIGVRVGKPKVSDVGAGLVRLRVDCALERNPGVGVWHLETDVGAGIAGNTRTERTVFEVLSDDPAGPCPPLVSGLPEIVSMPNEIAYLEESAFDPWGAFAGASHYFAIDMRYPMIGNRLRAWEADHVYRRKYFTWSWVRNSSDYDMYDEYNRELMRHADYFGGYPNEKHCDGRYDFAQTSIYRGHQLRILADYLKESGIRLKLLTPERIELRLKEDKGISGEELKEVFDTCWNGFKAYGRRRVDDFMKGFVDYLLGVNPRLARASYGPMPVYASSYLSPYSLEYDGHPLDNDLRLQRNGSFWLLEDYHYCCDYRLCRPEYFVAGYLMLNPVSRKIYPEIYYQIWQYCGDGAVYQAHPEKFPPLNATHQRRIAYGYAYGTPYLRDGAYGYWKDCGFHMRNPEREALDEFLYAWGKVIKNRPSAPLKAPYAVVDPDQFRLHGETYMPRGSYAMEGPGFSDVRSDIINTAEEGVGYAVEQCCEAGFVTPVVTRLRDIGGLSAENCEFLILPPIVKGTPPETVAAIRRAHERGVNLLAFESAAGLEDLFGLVGAGDPDCLTKETRWGRTAFVNFAPTLRGRSTFYARYSRGRDNCDPAIDAAVRKLFAFLSPKPAVKTERGEILAATTVGGDTVVALGENSALYGCTDSFPATFRFTVSAPGIEKAAIEADAPYSVVEKSRGRLVLRTRTDRDTALFFRFSASTEGMR